MYLISSHWCRTYSDEVLECLEEYLIVISISVCWGVSLLARCGRAPRQERVFLHRRAWPQGVLPHPQDTSSGTFPPDPTRSRGLASFTQNVAFCPQNNVSCPHCTSAWLPCRSCSWSCYLHPDSVAVVLGNSAGSSIVCMEVAFLCVRSWRLLKYARCLWSCMTSGSNPPTNNVLALRYTILHQGTCRTLTNWDYGSSKLQCVTDWDSAYPSTEIFGQGHFSAATHTSVCTTGLHRWEPAPAQMPQQTAIPRQDALTISPFSLQLFTGSHFAHHGGPLRPIPIIMKSHYEKLLWKGWLLTH